MSTERVHRRRNVLTGEWVLVSPHRAKRPWQGKVETASLLERPSYDDGCYLCPGNTRASGKQNPEYKETFVFDNDFAALTLSHGEDLQETVDSSAAPNVPAELFQYKPERGLCRVLCFSPRHDLTLAEMKVSAIQRVVQLWAQEYEDLGSRPEINYVQIFENKGDIMGCSNPHPHGQVWAQETLPNEPFKELLHQKKYWDSHGATLLGDYLVAEVRKQERLVCANDHFVALVPFWATWPFETLVVSRKPVASLLDLHQDEYAALADLLKRLTTRYDNLFEVSFPYSAGLHQAPTDGVPHPEWHLHMHFYPPLLRSATVKKFMVGYEMLGEPQRDISAEQSAFRLRELSETHYRDEVRVA